MSSVVVVVHCSTGLSALLLQIALPSAPVARQLSLLRLRVQDAMAAMIDQPWKSLSRTLWEAIKLSLYICGQVVSRKRAEDERNMEMQMQMQMQMQQQQQQQQQQAAAHGRSSARMPGKMHRQRARGRAQPSAGQASNVRRR